MAIHSANEVKHSYGIWVFLLLIDVIASIFMRSILELACLFAFNGLFVWVYLGRYRITQVNIESNALSVHEINAIGGKRSHKYTDIDNIDVTYGVKPIPNGEDGLVLICYHETFRDFILFPNKNGWTEGSIVALAMDFSKLGYRVNNSDDPHVW